MAVITTGDDVAIPVQLEKKVDGKWQAFEISGTAIIKAVLTSLDRMTIISDQVTINNNANGTNLAASLIIVEFTEAQSEAISEFGQVYLEVQVDDGKKLTWTEGVLVRKGNIQ